MAKSRRTRRKLSDEQKIKSVKRIKGGSSVLKEANRIDVAQSVIRRWLDDERYQGDTTTKEVDAPDAPEVKVTRRGAVSDERKAKAVARIRAGASNATSEARRARTSKSEIYKWMTDARYQRAGADSEEVDVLVKHMVGPKRYSENLKRRTIERVNAGSKVVDEASKLGTSASLIYQWMKDPRYQTNGSALPTMERPAALSRRAKELVPSGYECPHCGGAIKTAEAA